MNTVYKPYNAEPVPLFVKLSSTGRILIRKEWKRAFALVHGAGIEPAGSWHTLSVRSAFSLPFFSQSISVGHSCCLTVPCIMRDFSRVV